MEHHSPIHCPKCKKMKIRIVEHIVCPEVMYQNTEGRVSFFTGEGGGPCYVIKWEAVCLACGKKWQLRKSPPLASVNIPAFTSHEEREKWLNKEPVWWDDEQE